VPDADLSRKREVVEAFLGAARRGDFAGLLAILDPDVVLRLDHAVGAAGTPREIRGAETVAQNAARGGARAAQPALVDGELAVVVAPRGRLLMVLYYTVRDGKITEIEAVADPERLEQLEIAVLDG
jgi:RNA polymerase sigma-70 factor (ECF subfamily)